MGRNIGNAYKMEEDGYLLLQDSQLSLPKWVKEFSGRDGEFSNKIR